jgi:hypothetical protein
LFAHAFIGLLIVAIGIAVDLSPVTTIDRAPGQGFDSPTYRAEIFGIDLAEYWGRYHIDPNFREEFSSFRSVHLPASESDFMAHAHDLQESREHEIDKHWKIQSLVIDGEAISFQTTTHNHERYVFSGRFRLTPKCSLATISFAGQLTKIKDDVVVATTNAEFHKVCGC